METERTMGRFKLYTADGDLVADIFMGYHLPTVPQEIISPSGDNPREVFDFVAKHNGAFVYVETGGAV